jgi:two-component system, response regulator
MISESEMKTDILLVEDSAEDAELAIRVIRQDNPAVRMKLLRDGAEAVDYLFDESENAKAHFFPKIIFLDVKLPRLTGPEVLKRLKSNELTRSIPVIIMTSSCQKCDIEECYRLGANSYLVKPIDFTRFQAMIISASRYWLNYNIPLPV